MFWRGGHVGILDRGHGGRSSLLACDWFESGPSQHAWLEIDSGSCLDLRGLFLYPCSYYRGTDSGVLWGANKNNNMGIAKLLSHRDRIPLPVQYADLHAWKMPLVSCNPNRIWTDLSRVSVDSSTVLDMSLLAPDSVHGVTFNTSQPVRHGLSGVTRVRHDGSGFRAEPANFIFSTDNH